MLERLRRLREPVVVVLLVVLALRLVVSVGAAVAARGSGTDGAAVALSAVAFQVVDPLTSVLLACLLGSCLLWSPTPRARGLALWAFALTLLGVVLSVVAAIALLAVGTGSVSWVDAVRVGLQLVLPVLALVALSALLRSRREVADVPLSLEASSTDEATAQRQVEPSRDPANEPVWQADQAAGAAWFKAGDAAAGAAASGWGAPGDAGGWAPAEPPAGRTSSGPARGEQDQPTSP